jgi:hypothetical protein
VPYFNQSGFGTGRFGEGDFSPTPIYTLGISYYLALFTSQYQLCVNYLAWAQSAFQKMEDVSNAMNLFEVDFDPDYAVGVQLDTAGLIAGISRTVPFQPSGGVSPVLDDTTYRLLIKARLSRKRFDGKLATLLSIFEDLFPGSQMVVIDEQNMSATLSFTGIFSSIVRDLITNDLIIPRSETVQYNYVFNEAPIFGFSETLGSIISGFDSGFWS